MWNDYKQSVTMHESQSNDNICYNYIIISLLIIYSTFISIVLIFIKYPEKVVKKIEVMKYDNVMKDDEVIDNIVLQENNEQLSVLFEKQIINYKKLNTYWQEGRCLKEGHLVREKINGTYPMDVLVNKLTVNDLVLGLINEKVYQSMIQDIQTTNEEILIIAKKAGIFEASSELLNDLQKYIKPTNPLYNEYRNVLLNM